jgi:hypothetical protein
MVICTLYTQGPRFVESHICQNRADTRISCTPHEATATCAAFIEESRMKFINANKLHRKSGGMGHPSFVTDPAVRNSG